MRARRFAALLAVAGIAGGAQASPPAFLVADLATGTAPALPSGPWWTTIFQGVAYFEACQATTGCDLWRSDGTTAGSWRVKDLGVGTGASVAGSGFVEMGGALYFATEDFFTHSLWKTDGSEAGTVVVKDFSRVTGSNYIDLAAVGDTLFLATTDANGRELWKSDGTTAGTVLVKETLQVPFGSNLLPLGAAGSTLLFTTDDLVHGMELWRSEGSGPGTQLVKDILPGPAWTNVWTTLEVGSRLYLNANDGVAGDELWRSDGSEAGTQLVADVEPSSGGSTPRYLLQAGPLLYFSALTEATGRELYAMPVTLDPAVVSIAGTATGGGYRIATLSGVNVTIATIGGQSAATVAANLAAEISLDATAVNLGIFARVSGSSVILVGAEGAAVTWFTDDVGLGGDPPAVSSGGYIVLSALTALLGWTGWRRLRTRAA